MIVVPPSAYFPNVIVSQICTPGYARSVRHVPYRIKDRVYDRDGYPRHHRQGMLIDHRDALEDGGSNDISNLYAQPKAEARLKDRDESLSHERICSGQWSIARARTWLWEKWKR